MDGNIEGLKFKNTVGVLQVDLDVKQSQKPLRFVRPCGFQTGYFQIYNNVRKYISGIDF
jgi:hypothetical protein